MSELLLSSRAIMGMYFARLEMATGLWTTQIANSFTSNQGSETYGWLGQSPAMREWIGGRNAKMFTTNKTSIDNTHFEATIRFDKKDIRRDKTSQISARINDLADRAVTHWAKLLSVLLLNGGSTLCYDGSNYFDTTHAEAPDRTVQSNNISVTIANLPCLIHGVPTSPSMEEMQQAIAKGIAQILNYVDNQGEPMNELASNFIVMVPYSLWSVTLSALSLQNTKALQQNFNPNGVSQFNVTPVVNTRVNAWTSEFLIVRADSSIKPFIMQSETDVQLKAKAEGTEFEFDNDAWEFGIDAWRGVGYGYWQYACKVRMV